MLLLGFVQNSTQYLCGVLLLLFSKLESKWWNHTVVLTQLRLGRVTTLFYLRYQVFDNLSITINGLSMRMLTSVSADQRTIPRYIYEVHTISFQTFFVWPLLLIVHTWNSSPLRSNLLRLQCTCCTVLTTSGKPHRSPLEWACQWPSS